MPALSLSENRKTAQGKLHKIARLILKRKGL
jgi:hypothetical protein